MTTKQGVEFDRIINAPVPGGWVGVKVRVRIRVRDRDRVSK